MRDALGDQQLLFLKLHDLGFERAGDGGHVGFDDAFDRLVDLLLDFAERGLERRRLVLRVRLAAIPQIAEHGRHHVEQLRLRLRVAKDRLELTLNGLAADRLAVRGAALLRALIVGVALFLLAAARGPTGGEETAAIIAMHEAAKRKVRAEVGPIGRAPDAVQAVLYALEGSEADKRLVVSLTPRNVPLRCFDVACVNAVAKNIADPLMRDHAGLGLRVERVSIQEVHDMCLTVEAARGVAFERFGQHGRLRLLSDQYLAIEPGHAPVTVAGRCREDGEAVLEPRLHAVESLFGIVDAVIVRERNRDIL